MKTTILLKFLLVFMFWACESDDTDSSANCDETVILSSQLFQDGPSDELTINTISITDNCLKISFSASGCDGNSWGIQLIDSEEILESEPIQRRLRLSLRNEELCLAFITKEVSFDISGLQTNGSPIRLNIVDYEDLILYEF